MWGGFDETFEPSSVIVQFHFSAARGGTQLFIGFVILCCTLFLGRATEGCSQTTMLTTINLAQDHPNSVAPQRLGGGRVASDRYRDAIRRSEEFSGLHSGKTRFDLLMLVKRAGRDAGFSPKMVQLLEYYLTAFTQNLDWEEGRPIVYQSLAKTALDLGVSERQIQKLEKLLFEVGAIGYVDSGNCKRYGQRDPRTGRILWAFGVDLSPLAHLQEELEERLREKQRYNRAWCQTKRDISSERRQIRSLLLEWRGSGDPTEIERFEQAYCQIAYQIRTHLRLEKLQELLQSHKALHARLLAVMGIDAATDNPTTQVDRETAKCSSTSDQADAHYKYTKHLKNICRQNAHSFQESVEGGQEADASPPSSGAEHVTLRQAVSAVSQRFRGYLPIDADSIDWPSFIEGADRLRAQLGVSQVAWGEACAVLGRSGAAICLLVTDRAALRDEQPARQPAAYFRGMVNRARRGELRLHCSIFGLLGQSSL